MEIIKKKIKKEKLYIFNLIRTSNMFTLYKITNYILYWVQKVRADVEGKLKRKRFKFYIFIKLYRLVDTNFSDNPINN